LKLKELEEEKTAIRSTKAKAPNTSKAAEEEDKGLRKLVQEIVISILQAATTLSTAAKAKSCKTAHTRYPLIIK